eukprot:TRINITY_DN4175_c0_g1_i2.p1 TRINITY_DN4175_c0_g1~~TRINITY_DN4175_c0_g1_i2.p1  ORF type:complete len:295 (+),score=44.87 TRINITY_DN4175_c0_g1_i2:132-887(+)
MSVAKLSNEKYMIIDAIPLTEQIKHDLNKLTNNGENIEAVLMTHPFHTLSINDFHKFYPKAHYYGCPRHLKLFPHIPWAGNLNDCSVREKWSKDIELRIPAGAEFVNPMPEKYNHFSCVFVFHKESHTIHVDDTIMYSEDPGLLLKLVGFKKGTMSFHPSIKGPGLLPHPNAPFEFRDWVRAIINDWDFHNICTAHFGNKIGGAKEQLVHLTKDADDLFQKEHEKRKDPKYAEKHKYHDKDSLTVDGVNCG